VETWVTVNFVSSGQRLKEVMASIHLYQEAEEVIQLHPVQGGVSQTNHLFEDQVFHQELQVCLLTDGGLSDDG